MTKQELERWLCGAERPGAGRVTIERGLDVPLVTFVESVLPEVPDERSQLRFTMALLRDIFSSDGAARRWLGSPQIELGGRRPLDLFATGQIADVEMLLVSEWHLVASRGTEAGVFADDGGALVATV